MLSHNCSYVIVVCNNTSTATFHSIVVGNGFSIVHTYFCCVIRIQSVMSLIYSKCGLECCITYRTNIPGQLENANMSHWTKPAETSLGLSQVEENGTNTMPTMPNSHLLLFLLIWVL